MVHVTDVKKTTLKEQVADDYENLGKEGRFSKKCIPRGYIPDLNWTTIHGDQDQPIKPIQQQDPTEYNTTPAAPPEVEGPPSSDLRSKTKQQLTIKEQTTRMQCSLAGTCKVLLSVSLVVHIVSHGVGEYCESVPLDHTGSYVLSA